MVFDPAERETERERCMADIPGTFSCLSGFTFLYMYSTRAREKERRERFVQIDRFICTVFRESMAGM